MLSEKFGRDIDDLLVYNLCAAVEGELSEGETSTGNA